jgi:hypothetical protein
MIINKKPENTKDFQVKIHVEQANNIILKRFEPGEY